MTTVKLMMSDRVVGIAPDSTLQMALRMMAEAHVRHLPVIAGNRCLGLLTESDALWHAWATGDSRCPVTDVMRSPTPAVDVEVPLTEAARAVLESDVDAVVVTAGGELVGILTSTDLVRAVAG